MIPPCGGGVRIDCRRKATRLFGWNQSRFVFPTNFRSLFVFFWLEDFSVVEH
jgi:hypothetical protein